MVTAWNLFGMKSVTFLISKVLEPQIDETQKTKLSEKKTAALQNYAC